MAKNYEEKRVYYIPAFVERIENLGSYPVKVSFRIGEESCAVQFEDLPDLMFTAEEVVKENDLDTLLRDEVVTENRKLKAKVKTAEEAVGTLKTKADAMTVTADSLREENEKLKTKVERLTTWYEEANRTASEAMEANDELKAKIAELRTRNAELEALLKEVTATRDEAIKQNEDLESELEDARHVNEYAVETARSKEKLVGEQRELVKKYSVVIDILIDKITALKKGENDG